MPPLETADGLLVSGPLSTRFPPTLPICCQKDFVNINNTVGAHQLHLDPTAANLATTFDLKQVEQLGHMVVSHVRDGVPSAGLSTFIIDYKKLYQTREKARGGQVGAGVHQVSILARPNEPNLPGDHVTVLKKHVFPFGDKTGLSSHGDGLLVCTMLMIDLSGVMKLEEVGTALNTMGEQHLHLDFSSGDIIIALEAVTDIAESTHCARLLVPGFIESVAAKVKAEKVCN